MLFRSERKATVGGAMAAGRVRYDRQVTAAQIHAQSAVEYECEAANDIRDLWRGLNNMGDRCGIRL